MCARRLLHPGRAQWLSEDKLSLVQVESDLKLVRQTANALTQKAGEKENFIFVALHLVPVSYTHLDVYKRQRMHCSVFLVCCFVVNNSGLNLV